MDSLTITNQDGQAVTTTRHIAASFGRLHKDVLENVREILVAENSAASFFFESTYENRGKRYPEFIMNRDGFTLLAMGFTGVDAMQWKIKYIQAFNEMEKQLSAPMSQLEIMVQSAQALLEQDKAIKQLTATQNQQAEQLQGIRDVVALSHTDWREDSKNLIAKMAQKLGGYEHINILRKESYDHLNARMGVSVATRLTNMRRRMADEGVCKSKRDKLNALDVIADDKKLIEGYVAIIKEMAIKYSA